MTVSVEAPMLAGSRPRAQRILETLPDNLTGQVVQLHCGLMIAAAASFADEIVRGILVDRNAARLEVTSVSDQEFIGYLTDQAAAHNVTDRLQILPSNRRNLSDR